MPKELLKEFIGKNCIITLMNNKIKITGIVEDVEGYWIKIQEKDSKRIMNGAIIRDIKTI